MNTTRMISFAASLFFVSMAAQATCNYPKWAPSVSSSDIVSSEENSYVGTTGQAFLFTSPDGVLDKPLVVVEGYDPTNVIGCNEVRSRIRSLTDSLVSQGTDLVIVNFQDGGLYIEQNALFLQKVLGAIGGAKTGTHPLAVVGLSMGGLVSRYTLTRMEQYGIAHNVSLYISYDSPQKFANVPYDIQYLLGTGAMYGNSSAKEAFTSSLARDSARQMLASRFGQYWIPNTPNIYDYRDSNGALQNKLKSIGNYPTKLRKVAFANGSGNGPRGAYPYQTGSQLFTVSYGGPITSPLGYTWSSLTFSGVAETSQQLYNDRATCRSSFKYEYYVAGSDPSVTTMPYECVWAPVITSLVGSNPSSAQMGFDAAPGSYVPTFSDQLTTSLSPITTSIVLNIIHSRSSFIPTISSLDVNTTDLYYDVASDPNILLKTPFNAIYFPRTGVIDPASADNEEHLQLTNEKINQLKNELALYHRPGEADDDGDGLTNALENQIGTDTRQRDSDMDGMSDGFEYRAGLNPQSKTEVEKFADRNGDLDGDGYINFYEACGSIDKLDATCNSSYQSDAKKRDSTPVTVRAAIISTIVNSLLLN